LYFQITLNNGIRVQLMGTVAKLSKNDSINCFLTLRKTCVARVRFANL